MKWSICLPSYNNFTEVYFTVQSLRMHHDLTDCEIVVVDNYGDKVLENFCKAKGGLYNWDDFKAEYPNETKENFDRLVKKKSQGISIKTGMIRYEKYTDITGVSAAKNQAIKIARGEYVLCMDSHILLKAGALDIVPQDDDLVQGPHLDNNLLGYKTEWFPVWRRNMWGIWGDRVDVLPERPFEIWAMGAGFFCCRRDSWLGFNPSFRGFGGETGYIQEKYRQAGQKVWCDPSKVWMHMFCTSGRPIPFPIDILDRIRNYIIGFNELGLPVEDIKKHFGNVLFEKALKHHE